MEARPAAATAMSVPLHHLLRKGRPPCELLQHLRRDLHPRAVVARRARHLPLRAQIRVAAGARFQPPLTPAPPAPAPASPAPWTPRPALPAHLARRAARREAVEVALPREEPVRARRGGPRTVRRGWGREGEPGPAPPPAPVLLLPDGPPAGLAAVALDVASARGPASRPSVTTVGAAPPGDGRVGPASPAPASPVTGSRPGYPAARGGGGRAGRGRPGRACPAGTGAGGRTGRERGAWPDRDGGGVGDRTGQARGRGRTRGRGWGWGRARVDESGRAQ